MRHGIEPSAGKDERVAAGASTALGGTTEARHHAVDIGFDVDSRFVAELFLTVWKTRQGAPGAVAYLGGHDFVDVRECHERCIRRHQLELIGAALVGNPT